MRIGTCLQLRLIVRHNGRGEMNPLEAEEGEQRWFEHVPPYIRRIGLVG